MKKHRKLIAFLLLIGLSSFSLLTALSRPIWFDEAWSIMVYAMGPFGEIYTNYNAPNNHILFNMLLRIWLETFGSLMNVSEISFRFMSVVTALISVGLMFIFWRKRMGLYSTFVTILCFIVSTPFIIYGTAIRGYILSFIFILTGLESYLKFTETGKKKYLIFYFLSSLGAVAVIPSNLFAFFMIAILPPKRSGLSTEYIMKFIKKRWLIFILPLLAFMIFYIPISANLYNALKNNNGWLHPIAAVIHLYSGFCLNLFPLIILAVSGFITLFKTERKNPIGIICCSLIFLTPAIIILCRRPAPFPRVFLQMWPVWLFLLGTGIKHMFSSMILKKVTRKKLFQRCAVITFIIITWGIIHSQLNPFFSTVFTRKFSHDDFFNPLYMSKNFRPSETVDLLLQLSEKKPKTVFLSQNSDFISLIFYGKLKGIQQDFWITDYPGKTELEANPDSKKYYIVARNEKDLYLIKERFKINELKPILTSGLDKIYEVNDKTTEKKQKNIGL